MTYAQSLPGCPGADVFASATVRSWVEDLWMDARYSWIDPDSDRARIAEAFRRIRQHAERWPTQADFARNLPSPPTHTAIAHRPCTDEQAKANIQRLVAEMKSICQSTP